MNTNELIEDYKPVLASAVEMVDVYTKLDMPEGMAAYREEVEKYSSLLSILNRSRIRQTATEPPTDKDSGTFDGMTGMVIAKTRRGQAVIKAWWIVSDNPDGYPRWTGVPDWTQLPEVTP